MGFIGLTLTKAGRRLIASAISEEDPLNITHIQLGEGVCEGTFAEMKGLAKKVMEIPVKSVKRDEGKVVINCDFNSTEAPKGFYFREVGIIGNGVLCYYDNSGDDAEYIDPETEGVIKQKRLRFTLTISSDVTVTVKISSELYAMAAEVEESLEKKLDKTGDASETTVTFEQASEREDISSGEKLSVLFGKVAKWLKWLSDLKTVAFTGKYADLSGVPEIPTYGAATQSANGLMSTSDKKKLDGLNKSAYIGNGTGFVRPNHIGGSTNANDYVTEWHGFVYNMSNLPESYGFLDVTCFDGNGFTPSPPDNGGVVRQVFTAYNTGKIYARVRVNNSWTSWIRALTNGSTVVSNDTFYMIDPEGRSRMVMQTYGDGSGASNYGSQLILGAGGNTFIGSGESASALYGAFQTESNKKANEIYGKNGENMFISSDGHLYLYSNANQIANRKGICFSNAGILSPVGIDNISFGTLDYPFYDIFATNLRLKPKGANYGSKFFFGDGEYVYLYEDTDDHLKIYAARGAAVEIGDGYNIEFGKKKTYNTGANGNQELYPCHIKPDGTMEWTSDWGQPIPTSISKQKVRAYTGHFYEADVATRLKIEGALYFGGYESERIQATNRQLELYGYGGIVFRSCLRSDVCPADGGTYKVGTSSSRWKEIWCSTSLNTSSDRNLKKDIQDLSSDERYIKFFMLLQPKSYLFKDGESGRTHVGFISQDVEEAMAECGLSSLEFAGFCKDQKRNVRTEMEEIHHPADEETGKEAWTERKEKRIEEPVFGDDGNPVYEYSLRYEEFIAFNTMMIQKLYKKNETLEDRISKLEEKIL